jgi:hypothetical protein
MNIDAEAPPATAATMEVIPKSSSDNKKTSNNIPIGTKIKKKTTPNPNTFHEIRIPAAYARGKALFWQSQNIMQH